MSILKLIAALRRGIEARPDVRTESDEVEHLSAFTAGEQVGTAETSDQAILAALDFEPGSEDQR